MQVVNAHVTASIWYPTLTCSWALPSGHTTSNCHDRRAKPGEGLRGCVCLHNRTPFRRHNPRLRRPPPQMTTKDEPTNKFYEDLHALLTSVPKVGKLVVLGDINARGSCNENALLMRTCAELRLVLTNTSSLLTRQNATWMHPQIVPLAAAGLCFSRRRDR
ncbi:unnamed protein product [Schistocephalus solidus]|uniref:Endo/exonuclease/phosphatase domain-containing protein n=1 Tax=Schistocephalus solidus TaxID=70667 RepID=A0A183SN30_SCHSO|nr:unnamed protein product [Schistocephalus solidus]